MDAALGCRTNVFQVNRSGSTVKKNAPGNIVTIHPQASPLVCRHVLDTLIALAKSFPNHFLPDAHQVQQSPKDDSLLTSSQTPTSFKVPSDFWEVLIKLDVMSNNRKGKSALKNQCKILFLINF